MSLYDRRQRREWGPRESFAAHPCIFVEADDGVKRQIHQGNSPVNDSDASTSIHLESGSATVAELDCGRSEHDQRRSPDQDREGADAEAVQDLRGMDLLEGQLDVMINWARERGAPKRVVEMLLDAAEKLQDWFPGGAEA